MSLSKHSKRWPIIYASVILLLLFGCGILGIWRFSERHQSFGEEIATDDEMVDYYSTSTGVFSGYLLDQDVANKRGFGKCPMFVVTSEPDSLWRFFYDLTDRGNIVNKIDESGRLILRIELDLLDKLQSNILIESGPEQTATIYVRKRTMEKGATDCTSFLDIEAVARD